MSKLGKRRENDRAIGVDQPIDPVARVCPPTANLTVKGITNRRNPESQTQENRDPSPAFLQNRMLAHVKSQRRINHFRILHGRPIIGSRFLAIALTALKLSLVTMTP